MIATVDYVERKFWEFNRRMFGSKLPRVPIVITGAKTFLGKCTFKRRRDRAGHEQKYDFQLRISRSFDLPEPELEDTIIHEMIHYYIGVNQLPDTSSHGVLFRRIMEDINIRYHRHISISYRPVGAHTTPTPDIRPRWHVVARIIFRDGRVAVKVLPRVVQSILKFYNAAVRSSQIRGVELYMCNNPFFNKYPNSSSMKVFFLDDEEFRKNLTGAERLGCDGRRIIRNWRA